MYTMQPRIRGAFHSANEGFNRDKHEVYIKVKANGSLKKLTDQLPVERVTSVKPTPQPEVCRNMDTEAVNDTLTLDGDARINGNHLKFDKSDPKQGVFLIDSKDQEVRMAKFTDVLPKQLTFRVPKTLAKGEYRVEVRSTMGTQELRSGRLPNVLTVK